ncbi:LLM class flavin-dependent oxidoreductase [Candidatus Bathyarchaeota archaeon]|nr:MAG: LLM class flavin-dependent oxidoreductase [Candidatus Bathyarchaeota archaeon]
MRFILSGLGNWFSGWSLTDRSVQLADKLGFWGAVIPDHYMWAEAYGQPQKDSTVESWIALAYLAAKTQNIKLGTIVTPIPFRPPAMLAKMVSTMDVLSSGRAILGVGAGWSQTEFEGYSTWDDSKTRVDKTREGVELILQLWEKPQVDFKGKYYHAKGAILDPKPVQKPHPPLMFGGVGTRMLRLAGQYSEICHIPPWVNVPMEKARSIVRQEARRFHREDKIAFAGGSVANRDQKFDLKAVGQEVEKAAKDGALYYIAPLHRTGYLDNLKEFAKSIIPSFSGLD